MEQAGHDGVDSAVYRLIDLDIYEIRDAEGFPYPWKPTYQLERLRLGKPTPPVVVVQSDAADSRPYNLIDGFNRTYAYWVLGRPRIRAYELLVRGHS